MLGVRVSAVDIREVIRQMRAWIGDGSCVRTVAVTGMHGVMEAHHDRSFKEALDSADAVVPDGMPLIWLGRLRGLRLNRRVYGPELMLAFCKETASEGYRHFFYGGGAGVPESLVLALQSEIPNLRVAGTLSPPFRPLTSQEDAEVVAAINAANPEVLWVGLGTPKQEIWMNQHRGRLRVPVVVTVGAAFDINSGLKEQAPAWMRENGLEWLFRLAQEPKRLWRRYIVYGSEFVLRLGLDLIGIRGHAPVD